MTRKETELQVDSFAEIGILQSDLAEARRQLEERDSIIADKEEQLSWTASQLKDIKQQIKQQLAASQQRERVLESDSELLSQIIDISNHGEPLLDESIWDDLPGDSEDVQEEMRAALRKRVAAQASAEGMRFAHAKEPFLRGYTPGAKRP